MTLQIGPSKRGELLLASRPFVHAVSESHRLTLCNQCLSRHETLQRCSACTVLRYCSKKCQKIDWQSHKRECAYLKKHSPNVPTESVRLFFRLLLKYQGKETVSTVEEIRGLKRCFNDLMAHVEEIKQDEKRMKQFLTLCEGLKHHLHFDLEGLSPEDLLNVFGRMTINSFSICDPEMQPVGVGVYLIPSKLDHSCEPNAVVTFQGNELQLRTTQPLSSLSEVRISYIDQLSTTTERRQQLRDQYYFTCECSRCKNTQQEQKMLSSSCPSEQCMGHVLGTKDGNALHCDKCGRTEFSTDYELRRNNAITTVVGTIEKLKDLKKQSEDSLILDIYTEFVDSWKDVLHPSSIYVTQLLDHAFDASINLSKWEHALKHGRSTLKAYRMYYPDYHPALGIQLMKIGKIHLHLMDIEESLKYLRQAEDILQVTHGKDSRLFRDLKELQYQCNVEQLNNL